jgi:protein-S-isoprenylcysteine O-methyltransferase Ste14
MAMDYLPVATVMATIMLVVIVRMGITMMLKSNVRHPVYALLRWVMVATKVPVCPSAARAMVVVGVPTSQMLSVILLPMVVTFSKMPSITT